MVISRGIKMVSTFEAQKFTDRTLIESIVSSFYIVDYGFIKKINADKTIDVTHAKQLKTLDGKTLQATVTTGIEVLTIAGSGFSINFDYKKGDKVLLLGLKNYVPKTGNVISATETTVYVHYSRETLKAIPLCVFNDEAKVKIEADAGTLKISTEKKIELNGNTKQFVTWAELNSALQTVVGQIKAHTHTVSGGAAPASPDLQTLVLDITQAKTKTIVTGG